MSTDIRRESSAQNPPAAGEISPSPSSRPHDEQAAAPVNPPPPQKIRWGVIGSGGIARRRTIPEGLLAAPNAQLVAVYNRSQDVNAEVARSFKVHAAGTIEELLQSDIDAVYIASPPEAHLTQTLACAAARKHVLCEKPLALSVADAEKMHHACTAAGVQLGTALMMRFQAQHVAARDLVAEGRIGRPVFARAQLSCWYPPIPGAWRQDPAQGGGGALMDLGGHCIDLLEFFFGPAEAVSCQTARTIHDYPVEDGAVVTLRFARGALGVVDTFFCIRDESSRNVLELYGSAGSIHGTGTIGQGMRGRMVARLSDGAAGYDAQQARAAVTEVTIEPEPVNMYRGEIEEFSRAILERHAPANDAALGVRSQQVLAACYESARSGRTVRL
jgi:predicted dehydrogenase